MTLSCLPRVLNSELKRFGFILSSTPRIFTVQAASITSKELRDPNIKKPAPWPYEEKPYTAFRAYFDFTTKRFDENTKVILVDGTIGAGKGDFAKQLADAFDMMYFPEPNMDRGFITPYGYNLRDLDSIVPKAFQTCDLNTFYQNPQHHNVAKFQFTMFKFRLEDYIDVLCHVLNTGQGVVMERSVYSDFVFFDAMYKAGLFRKELKDFYELIQANTLDELMKPHLIVYLDVSSEVALKRIKEKNNPIEVNSPILNKEYLDNIEYIYKQEFLKKMEPHSEILIYDWNNYGDVEVVVEDIERIDFERFTKYETKLNDWRKIDEWAWCMARKKYTMEKDKIMDYTVIVEPDLTEIHPIPEDIWAYREIMEKVPGEKYVEGYNADLGENAMFRFKGPKGYRHMTFNRC